ncbi:MAG: hypothetical protein OEU36_11665 [Gammaproteobacteria bacterium]|nr:hypothetical protein [Gammaproteobacteria bacterium]
MTRFTEPRFWFTWMWAIAFRGLSLLPLPVLWLVGTLLGQCLYWLHTERRHVATRNIDRCFPELSPHQRKRLVRRHFRVLGQAVFDVGVTAWASEKRFNRLVRFAGLEHLEQSQREGRNVLILAPHFSTMTVGALALAQRGPLVAMYRPPRNPLVHAGYRLICDAKESGNPMLDLIVHSRRPRHTIELVDYRYGMRSAIKNLLSGTPLYYLPDQDLGKRHKVFAPFFNIQTSTISATSRFAELGSAVVILCAAKQLSRGQGYEIILSAPFDQFPSGDEHEDATRMNMEIEKMIRTMPEQYFWVHQRFKTRPEGEPSFY